MEFTREQEAQLLQTYEPFLAAQVQHLRSKGGRFNVDETEDLMQEARIAFLKHLRKMSEPTDICACKRDILMALWDYWVGMAVIRIPRARYKKEITAVQYISVDSDELDEPLLSDDDTTFAAELTDFLSTLTPEEQTVVEMKMNGCTSRAIMPCVGVTCEAQMTRLLQRVRRKTAAYFSN